MCCSRLAVVASVDSSSRANTATIVGAGISGLAAAIALRKAGWEVSVFERATELKQNAGTGLAIWPNGMKSLMQIDEELGQAVKDAGCCIETMGMKTLDGSVDMSNPSMLEDQYGQPLVCIQWSSLQQVLYSFLPEGTVTLGCKFTGYEVSGSDDMPGNITARFEGRAGRSAQRKVTSDALIGSDGINSHLRQLLLSDGEPLDAGRVLWRAVIHDAAAVARLEADAGIPRGTSRAMLPTMTPGVVGKTALLMDVGPDKLYWAAGALDDVIQQEQARPSALLALQSIQA